eukprot:SAG31_NODE_184_length_20985_cov_28.867567_23_plen_182_part_01
MRGRRVELPAAPVFARVLVELSARIAVDARASFAAFQPLPRTCPHAFRVRAGAGWRIRIMSRQHRKFSATAFGISSLNLDAADLAIVSKCASTREAVLSQRFAIHSAHDSSVRVLAQQAGYNQRLKLARRTAMSTADVKWPCSTQNGDADRSAASGAGTHLIDDEPQLLCSSGQLAEICNSL